MSLPKKAFNGVVAAMKFVARVEPTSESTLKEERVRRQKLDETLSYPALKVMTRSDAKERVRIVQKGQDFGAVVDFDDPKCGWSPEHILAGGFIYESSAVAEAEARATLGWLKGSNQEPSIDSRGHMGVSGSLRLKGDEWPHQLLRFAFDFDPSKLATFVRSFGTIAPQR